ncbi:hypothetical protein DPMN_160553 [Dreissena polymorpha]|uniref:Uncharacterized protein n=1 Tax=Dreissena polymorpha TaxID=45954 RepID=A0A9D4EL02_DREPO|nr:hypothetical protein DPMN_160553 [Dreissena polymorpha]
MMKTAPHPGVHVFQPTRTIFELVQDIIGTYVLTNFYEHFIINVASRTDDGQKLTKSTLCSENCPPPSSHETNVLTKFHENWAKKVNSTVFTCFNYIHIKKNDPPTGGHVFSPIPTIYKLVRDINKINVLTNFHDDWAKIVTSRGKLPLYIYIVKNAPPTGGHVFSPISTIFELVLDIN